MPKAKDFERLTENIGVIRGSTNIGIVAAKTALYLIDTGGTAQDGKDCVSIAHEIFPEKKIAAILNTHSHADHTGGNAVVQASCDSEVWAPYKEGLLMAFPEATSVMYWGASPFEELKSDKFITEAPCNVSRFLREGECIELEGIKIKCIPLLGHNFDQFGYLVTQNNGQSVFFLGDGLFGMSMLKKYWIPFMRNQKLFRKSVEIIEKTPADFYVPSHGDVCPKGSIHALCEMNQIVTLEMEALILLLLRKVPLTQEELLEAVAGYAGIEMKMSQFILIGSTLRSYLACLKEDGKVSYKMEDNRMLWYSKA